MKIKGNYWLGVVALTVLLSVGTITYGNSVYADSDGLANAQQVPTATNLVNPNNGNATWNLSSDGTLTISGTKLAGADPESDLYPGLNKNNVKKIVIANKMSGDKNLRHLFADFSQVTEIDGLNNLDTSQTAYMLAMFFGLSSLKSLDVSSLNTTNVTDMNSMFGSDSTLKSLDLSHFDTSKVTDMAGMFTYDSSLISLDLSSFDTRNVIYTGYMFYANNNLWQLGVGPNVTKDFLTSPLSSFPTHSDQAIIPGSSNTTTGSGWMAVDSSNGGTVDNPQGKTIYDATFSNWIAPTTSETYVWQQKSTPVALQTVKVETVDSGTQQPILGTTDKTLTGYPNQTYNVDASQYRPAINGYTWDGKVPTNATGQYKDGVVVKYVYVKNTTSGGSTVTSPATITSSSNNSTSTTTGSSSSTSSSSSSKLTTTTKPATSVGPNISVNGEAVYATKKIGLYKNTSFTKSKRIAWYLKQKRVNRPMFVVTGYAKTSNGTLRYKVRDVNYGSKTAGKTGYITANRKYVVPVYYASVPKPKKITVISPKGVNAYKSVNLTGKAKHYKKGAHLTVKKLVKHNLTTRYQLSNGKHVTTNKKLIIAGNY